MLEWLIIGEDIGKKLNLFLSDRLGDRYSARALKRALEENRCQINGRVERFASTVLSRRDHVTLDLEGFSEERSRPTIDLSRVLYEDGDLLVYNKPSGVNCDVEGIVALLTPSYPGIELIHRLDKETTGVLLFAKNQETLDLMVLQFKERRVKKYYLALVDGVLSQRKGTIQNYLGKKSFFHGQTLWGEVSKNEGGLLAHTDWELVRQGKSAALVRCFPLTGRMHQLRVHMSEMGHPILGDFQYCKQFRCSYRPARCMLHAYEVRFNHPKQKGKAIVVRAPIPADFAYVESIVCPPP